MNKELKQILNLLKLVQMTDKNQDILKDYMIEKIDGYYRHYDLYISNGYGDEYVSELIKEGNKILNTCYFFNRMKIIQDIKK